MNRPSLSNRTKIWSILVLILAVLVLIRSVAQGGRLEAWVGVQALFQARLVLGLIAALGLAWITLRVTRTGERQAYPALDRSFMWLVLSWAFGSVAVLVQEAFPMVREASALRYMAYQLTVAAALNFLRHTTQTYSPEVKALIGGQLLLGIALLSWRYVSPASAHGALEAWRILNVLGFILVFVAICWSQMSSLRQPPWLSLGACMLGLGMGVDDMAAADNLSLRVTVMHNVFSAYLLLIWLMLTNRIARLYVPHQPQSTKSEHSILGGEFADSYLSAEEIEEEDRNAVEGGALSDVTKAKRHFAQELHDGVGSQLVNILASLDRGVPQQREMAMAVEHCLLDVKILVDDIDGGQECVLDTLARLRYRVQPSLERLGIALTWDLQPAPELEQLRDERSRQVLRIAQEALANVMRHSRAKHVRLCCFYAPRTDALVLEIGDDGIGFDVVQQERQRGGKGLLGMRRRAQNILAKLQVVSTPTAGTQTRLELPLGGTLPLALNARRESNGAAMQPKQR